MGAEAEAGGKENLEEGSRRSSQETPPSHLDALNLSAAVEVVESWFQSHIQIF